MHNEYDIILANRNLSKIVTKGTILLILNKKPNVYEVEFVDEYGNFIEILSVNEEYLDGARDYAQKPAR